MSHLWAMSDGSTGSTSVHQGPARPSTPRARPALICAYPRQLALTLPDSGATLGRDWLAERALSDSAISSEHLRFDRAGGALRVVDLGSRNGTWVDGTRLTPHDAVPLVEGALLRIGKTLFVFREKLEGPLTPAPPIGLLVGPFGLRKVARTIDALAHAQVTNVLLEGETGVGKELSARAIATALKRQHPFAAINVAALASGVFESQIFGHVAGAFSGASTASPGVARAHAGGTLFLDEIGELALGLQAKLLRLLDNREVLPVGAERPVQVDITVLAATHRDLPAMVEQGSFRRDLYARLAMARIRLPPLRERSEDIFSVAAALAQRQGATLVAEQVEVEAIERLCLEAWPNNVRELAAALAAAKRHDSEPGLRLWALEEALGPAPLRRQALTHQAVEAAVEAAGGNVTAAARSLGVSRGMLLRLRKKHS